MPNKQHLVHLSDALEVFVDKVDEAFEQDSPFLGEITTGFYDIDVVTGGFLPGELTIIGGATATGKTSLLFNIASNIALSKSKPVLIASAQDSVRSMTMRLVASLAQIPFHRLKTGRLLDDDWPKLKSALELLNHAPIYFVSVSGFEIDALMAVFSEAVEKYGTKAIFVDGIQGACVEEAENKAAELASVTRALKNIAIHRELSVFASSSLNRYLYQRPNKRPLLSDLLGAGSVEHDADFVFFLYRDELYNYKSEDKGMAEVIIAKNRTGPVGTVSLGFLEELLLFKEVDIYM